MRELRADIDGIGVTVGHLIGGAWVDSPTTFETRSPLDWDAGPLALVARGDAVTADAAVAAAVTGFEAWGRTTVAERAEVLHRLADLIDAHTEEIAHVECLDMGFLEESMKLRLVARGAVNFRTYADLIVAHEDRRWDAKGMANHVQRMPAGPAVVITPVERPVHAEHVEARAGAGVGQHGDPQAGRVVAAVGRAARRADARGGLPAGRVQPRAGHRRGGRRGPRVRPARAPHHVHRLAAHRPPHRARRGREPRAVHRRARWQGTADRVRRRRPRRRGPSRRRGSTTTPARCASPAPGCSSRRRSATSSSSGSTGTSTRSCSATPRDPATQIAPMAHPDHRDSVHAFVERARAERRHDRARRQQGRRARCTTSRR